MHAVKNRTEQVVMVRLNSGIEINIAPRGKLDGVAESDIRGNAFLDKLRALGVVEISGPSAPPGGESSLQLTSEGEDVEPSGRQSQEPAAKDRSDTHSKHRKHGASHSTKEPD